MRTLSIITIHKIFNYGSLLQAYALQFATTKMGCRVEILDYSFPNSWHKAKLCKKNGSVQESFWFKLLFAPLLYRQHCEMRKFIYKNLNLSKKTFNTPEDLYESAPLSDIYMTGSDQVWNPTYCLGDPSFFLDFAPLTCRKVAYAASFGVSDIDKVFYEDYCRWLSSYDFITVREESGIDLIRRLSKGTIKAKKVLDPTLLLSAEQWNELAVPDRLVKNKYILCYFLNYSFDAFPYVEDLARNIQEKTGYTLVFVARPPHKLVLKNTIYKIGASPSEFLALIRDAELILTTSFHGTAFAVNYNRPLYSIVKNKQASDSRQIDLLRSLGLENRVLEKDDKYPEYSDLFNQPKEINEKLQVFRNESLDLLKCMIYG